MLKAISTGRIEDGRRKVVLPQQRSHFFRMVERHIVHQEMARSGSVGEARQEALT
jgi:hypothetical protein